MHARQFCQVDVFTDTPYLGNPVAVVLDAEGLSDEQMQQFARWTNLSETTFVLPPTDARADYRVRIFTASLELPFAGHPTLGTCHAWRTSPLGADAAERTEFVQECAAGLIAIRSDGDGLAFAAPPLVRSGPVDEDELAAVAAELGIGVDEIADAAWADNGPGWVAVRLHSHDTLRTLRPTRLTHKIGVVALLPAEHEAAYEVRAFFPDNGISVEDPVTGSLNASTAQWLLGQGLVQSPYLAIQGTALQRQGRVSIERTDDGTIWVGGASVTCISGTVTI